MASKQNFGAVVITGASSGIGEACAIYLDKLGYQVFAGVRRDADGEQLRRKTSVRLTPLLLDVRDEASIMAAANTVSAALNTVGLAGLVNNAGIVVAGPLEFLPVAELRKQLEVNVIGQIAVTQAFLPLLRKAQGRVINIGSDNGKVSVPFLGPYCASKFAMEALTDALRMELQPWGIEVSIIEPGTVTTPIWEKSSDLADDIWNKLPPQAHKLYSAAVDATRNTANKLSKNGFPAEVVAFAVAQALTAKKPKTRYVVGLDAQINIWLAKILPDRLLDKLIIQYLGLPKNP
ncbi:short-chain dehydrogenase/reductase SDR [Scytonema sp. HK-05]|uniref:SDR family oxidoreductase n=1 Tax=Scytonema sp. HK-05 TaxID=1137095 RepID=UPI000935D498|nr:SDR family oxidoreductase [Scytonema sp. HK-05]OKH55357.1 short-chain dehydrogenase/reductase [Scytonema sp. HK-05]BAY42779.1 short-chain dehydrogenase/reductase SDR [Scytonema sp. HK-05]